MVDGVFSLRHKCRAVVVVPDEAIDPQFFKMRVHNKKEALALRDSCFQTAEGKIVRMEFVHTTSVSDDYLRKCISHTYGTSLEEYRRWWEENLGRLGEWWHVLRLTEVSQ